MEDTDVQAGVGVFAFYHPQRQRHCILLSSAAYDSVNQMLDHHSLPTSRLKAHLLCILFSQCICMNVQLYYTATIFCNERKKGAIQ